ncbi:MAG: hypothetical protein AAGB22_11355, partial [Bacteroidota bacterium]
MKKVLFCCWVVLLAVFGISDGFGQDRSARPTKVNLYLQHLIEHPTRQYEDIHLVVRGDVDKIRARTVELGGHFKYRFRDYAAILLPVHRIPALVAETYVERLEAGMGKGQPLNDQSLLNNNVLPIHQGLAPLPEAYDGEGVIMGFIDSGIELNHPDFQLDSTGRTRVLMLWDQTLPFNAQLTPGYGYGQVWDSAQINAGISNHLDQVAFFGHGSNVTGIGAGNGRGGQNT